MADVPLLFQPFQLGGLTLRNRIVALPIGLTGAVDSGGAPTERLIAMYRRRAEGGAGLVTVEVAYVEPGGSARPGLLGFYSDQLVPQFSWLVDAIHDAGAAAAQQITDRWHTNFPYQLHELSVADIQAMADHYARGAERAVRAGYDAINVEAAHGWPLARFLSPLYNDRTDAYREPTAAPALVIRRIRAAVGARVPIIFRLALDEHAAGGLTPERVRDDILPLLEDAGVDALDLTFGGGPIARHVKAYLGTEPVYNLPGERLSTYEWARERLRVPIIGRSRITDPAMALRMVDAGAVDLLGIGRQLLADPEFPRKVEQHRWAAVNRCIGCDVCLAQSTIFNRNLRCTVNPELGREIERRTVSPTHAPRRVHVIGGGIAGLEAAWGLARHGHQVTLWEQGPVLGGLLRWVAAMPALNLRDLAYYGEYVAERLPRAGVTVRLGTAATAEALARAEGDTVVVATGARLAATTASVPDGPTELAVAEYLTGRPALGARVVVDGQGEGAEFAVSLARTGHQVWLVEAGAEPRPTPYDYAGRRAQALIDYLAEANVTFVGLATGVEGAPGGARVRYRNGRDALIAADAILRAGRQAGAPDLAALAPAGWDVHVIGDAVAPLGLDEALRAARVLVEQLSR